MTLSNTKIFSFFAGAGFLDLGFENSGYEVAFVNEINPQFMEAYKYARHSMGLDKPVYGYSEEDINLLLEGEGKKRLNRIMREVRAEGSVVGFIGGPPCPDFSIGGKNRGRRGDRGKLTLSYAKLIISMQPDFFLFENVKGLWKTKKHRRFYEEIKRLLHQAGYCMTERLINSIEYGAPQDRERIILIGFSKRFLQSKGHPVSSMYLQDFPWEQHIPYKREEVFALPWHSTTPFGQKQLKAPAKIIKELTVQHWFDKNEVKNHPNAKDFFQPQAGLKRMQEVEEGDDSRKSYKRLHRWRYSPTACYGNNEVHLHPLEARRISVAEALAIQSLPKTFALPKTHTLSDKFKMVGNGVPYMAAEGLAKTIAAFLENPNGTDCVQSRERDRAVTAQQTLPVR